MCGLPYPSNPLSSLDSLCRYAVAWPYALDLLVNLIGGDHRNRSLLPESKVTGGSLFSQATCHVQADSCRILLLPIRLGATQILDPRMTRLPNLSTWETTNSRSCRGGDLIPSLGLESHKSSGRMSCQTQIPGHDRDTTWLGSAVTVSHARTPCRSSDVGHSRYQHKVGNTIKR